MSNTADKHRLLINTVISQNTFEHQRKAAQRAFLHFNNNNRAVVIIAEMQSGKSGIALVLSCIQRQKLNDIDICDHKQLKDTLYLVTMADLSLLEQAKKDLASCNNVVVSNFINYESALASQFKNQPPKLIIIDECHYGAGSNAIRYSKIFDYLEKDNTLCNVAFISATPFSALYSAGSDSILRHNFKTSLVFHEASNEYHGIREMHHHNQIVQLTEDQRSFCEESLLRKRFIRQFKEHKHSGWSLIRVPSGQAQTAKNILLENGITEDQIIIIGQSLVGVDEVDLASIEDFKREYQTASMFDEKLIAITVAGFRAGINFGHEMKCTLINTWDSTIANIAAIVQANIGRACGYHSNTHAKHYTNLDAVSAYSELLAHLESRDASCEFEGLQQVFEEICAKYDVRGFDRGTTIGPTPDFIVTKKQDDRKTYLTKGYVAIPGKLNDPEFDFTELTTDTELLKAIQLIRQSYFDDNGPYKKKGRALRGEHQNWIKAQWVNGATYDNGTNSSAKLRALSFTSSIDNGESIEFNKIVNPGGETTEDKKVMATIFSTYNLSRKMDAYKRSMDLDDMEEICSLLGVETDDTAILLFQRGEFSLPLSDKKLLSNSVLQTTKIRHNSVF
ncbi:hypothetical protein PCNPT3_07965 [Psychromonas sp. CNPT3]|uniref:DEAD/DEAH box helicase family protein n=1 Tax=Psychromonas sp. CNPT3 TaxID=314282 RepID=UPI00006E56A4|nr:DEAD/DEAH box helicase family protein [Psychromonas sp. CNPT3]AGH81531.1 hypothetical protein PCNPT3_07965 [Psychromonas sp. CNPT3]